MSHDLPEMLLEKALKRVDMDLLSFSVSNLVFLY